MNKNNVLILASLLLTTVVAVIAKDVKQEIHFQNNYRDKGKLQDVLVNMTWRQRLAPHTRNQTNVTIPAGHSDTQKAPLLGYYLENVKVTPSGAFALGAGFTGIAKAGDNQYFVITSGHIPAGALNNKAEITGYNNETAYNLIINPGATVVAVNNNQAPVAAAATTKADRKADRKAAQRSAAAVDTNSVPVAAQHVISNTSQSIVQPNVIVVDDNHPAASPNVVVVNEANPVLLRRRNLNNGLVNNYAYNNYGYSN